MVKIGVIGVVGGWSSEKLADTLEAKTGYRLLIEMDKVRLDLPSGEAWYKNINITKLDCLMIKKIGVVYSPDMLERLEILRFLNERGLPVFSAPHKIMNLIDRLRCTLTLQLASIPMPQTIITEDIEEARAAVNKFGHAVFKPLYTSKARGMTVISDGNLALQAISEYKEKYKTMYIQKKINLHGQDLGIAFLGGRYVTTYARKNLGTSWNTTTNNGGKYVPYDPDPEIIEIARKAQALFQLDFTSVDVALTDDGPFVFEVSAFGGFRGLKNARNIDAAELYVDYVLEKLQS